MGNIAKFFCSSVKVYSETEEVILGAVYSDDPANPNHQWSKWTPSGILNINISNPDAQGQFIEGQEYMIRIEPANV